MTMTSVAGTRNVTSAALVLTAKLLNVSAEGRLHDESRIFFPKKLKGFSDNFSEKFPGFYRKGLGNPRISWAAILNSQGEIR
jgi:hypothetical protein